jgi:hypothetical protein
MPIEGAVLSEGIQYGLGSLITDGTNSMRDIKFRIAMAKVDFSRT